MRFISFRDGTAAGLALDVGKGIGRALRSVDSAFPGSLETHLQQGNADLTAIAAKLRTGYEVDLSTLHILPPLADPPKIICVGLNYVEHAQESSFESPSYPAIFNRFNSSLIGHGHPIVRPLLSEQLDYEGEMVAIIGRGGRSISRKRALNHVAGWSIFNDASIRDYQFKGAQWTVGKNFDGTGAFGPAFVTADEIPSGGSGLKLETRLNGQVVQSASTSDLIFDVAMLIEIISAAMTLQSGDIIVTGTPAGVGLARKPPLWMKDGDIVQVEIEGLGVLENPVKDELPGINV